MLKTFTELNLVKKAHEQVGNIKLHTTLEQKYPFSAKAARSRDYQDVFKDIECKKKN